MTQLTLYISNKATARLLEKLCDSLPGIYMLEHDEFDAKGNKMDKSYAKVLCNKSLVSHTSGLDEAIEDIQEGRLETLESAADLYKLLEK